MDKDFNNCKKVWISLLHAKLLKSLSRHPLCRTLHKDHPHAPINLQFWNTIDRQCTKQILLIEMLSTRFCSCFFCCRWNASFTDMVLWIVWMNWYRTRFLFFYGKQLHCILIFIDRIKFIWLNCRISKWEIVSGGFR